ncbi:MAG: hypothetical protein JWN14_112 [Chthonomonadales bacterium]|nr:hypothetical protein [Chthonomonadales bacterium]
MQKIQRFLGLAAFFCALLALVSGHASARSGGGGSGGGGTDPGVPSAPPLIFDYTPAVNAVTPSWSGDSTITNPIPGYYTYAILSLSIKAKSLNLPDNTPLYVTAYMSNQATGESLPPVNVLGMAVLSKTGQLKSKTYILNPNYQLVVRQLDRVVITTADGTIVATCHP